jgi:polar amino acid transport system substrate-binding protein
MKKTAWGGLLLLAVLLASVWMSRANSTKIMTFATVNWEPYAADNLPGNGFTSEILAEVCKKAGYEAKFVFLPWKRAMLAVEQGNYDALYSAYYSDERAETYAITDPYVKSPLVLCARAKSVIKYDGTVASLKPYKVGVVSGYVNTKAIDSADYLMKDESVNDLENLIKLIQGRVDVIVIDRFVATQYLKTSPAVQAGLDDVVFLSPPLEEKPVFAMFSKKNPDFKEKVAAFNKGLKAVEQDGTMDAILKKYGFNF